jgi:hypothetical protein
MKLIGSKTEQDFREELIKSHNSLFLNKEEPRLLGVLKTYFHDMKTAYFIDSIPEQGEDIYRILINTEIIAQIELDRYNPETKPLVDTIPIEQYRRGLSKIGQIKLSVAIDLAQKDLRNS